MEAEPNTTSVGHLPSDPWSLCHFVKNIETFSRDKYESVKIGPIAQSKPCQAPQNVDNYTAHQIQEEEKVLSATDDFRSTKPEPKTEVAKSDSTRTTVKRQMDSQGNAHESQFRKKAIRPQ